MTAKILNGQKLAEKIQSKLKADVENMRKKPGLAAIIVGENPASLLYVSMKEKACKELGIYSHVHKLPEIISENEIIELIENLNRDEKINGILVQLPLPKSFNERRILDSISPEKDVDCLTSRNLGKLFIGQETFLPATVKGVLHLIESTKIDLNGKNVVVAGQSNIVGKPLSVLLANKFATVTSCNIYTKALAEKTRKADILIVAVGKLNLIKADMVKKGAIVIDVGINRFKTGEICGDVDFEKVKKKASYITPVPGGVGPMTVACLMENVVEAAKK